MQKLANSKESKVPYDAQDNRNTTEYVQGLSAYYHRLLSLGHDPLLGLVVGVVDILTGRMTTIDKAGNIVSQVMENYADRKESDIFAAIAKQIIHFKTDITTSMGLTGSTDGTFQSFAIWEHRRRRTDDCRDCSRYVLARDMTLSIFARYQSP